ncbi:MAG: hypothetical protein IJ240_07410 [Clostridia bacterium]|nr:hypothetical protein [Clostridia bacterium]
MNAQLIHENGVAKIRINGETVSSVSFRSFRPQPGITKAFGDGGIRLMNIYPSGILNTLHVPYSQFGEYWLGEGKYDWDVLRAQMDQFISNAPNAYFSLMLQLDTRDWFLQEHPECPNSFFHLSEAECYQPWREAAKKCIRDTLTFLDREYPEKIYCVYVAAGSACEWYNRIPLDGNPLKEATYRKWTGDEERRLPSTEELQRGEHGMLLAEKESNVSDYWRFLADLNAETLLEYAHEVKTYNPGLLVGCFTGYLLYHDRKLNDSAHNGMIARVFDSPDIDLIFSPASYYVRGLESVSNSELPMASVRLHGKMYYHEIDNTTYPSNTNPYAQVLQQYEHRRHKSLRESVMYARRESACAFAALGTYWWFDMFGGWYDDALLQQELLAIGRVQETLYSAPVASNAEVAYLMDEESTFHLVRDNALYDLMISKQTEPLGRIGCQVDYYAAGDLLDPRFNRKQYKLYIFPNLIAPTSAMRQAVSELRASGASILFVYAPGVLKDGRFAPEGMEDLTGLKLRITERCFGYTLADNGPYNDDGMARIFGGRLDSANVFVTAEEPEDYIFGRGLVNDYPQFAVKPRENGGFDAWIAQGVIPDFILRPLAKAAGCHLVTEEGLPVYTNSRMLALFDHQGGTYTVRAPWNEGCLKELYTGETHPLSEDGQITLQFEADECKCFIHLSDKNGASE